MLWTIRTSLVASVMVAGAVWSSAQAADSIVGTWRLVSWVDEEVETKAVRQVFAPCALGHHNAVRHRNALQTRRQIWRLAYDGLLPGSA